MEMELKDSVRVYIRPYEEADFKRIQDLNREEGWSNLAAKHEDTKKAWENSNIAFVAETEDQEVIGYIRGITDTAISLFICELLINKEFRGLGLGTRLLKYVHDLYPTTRIEMLASSSSRSFYEAHGYRAFYGFRKTYLE
ncbi:GNAT family N-acetyltransferase [Virgibacillus doumboii]|uniref:GNAT family N-acetyltransferase n=1 Tax=Virgibacillus doumboii TaxID=2697503 RepID=UPI0013DFCC03|nr:GNAT family N-acetyltransferase [Virgibacillus doumboii]